MTHIQLSGCRPESLMMNLKGLGIFRMIAEQKDSEITSNWKEDTFELHTKLSKEKLINFFLNEYRPTPLVTPWNGGSGFFDVEDSIVNEIEHSDNERLKEYSEVIKDVRMILEEFDHKYSVARNNEDKKSMKEIQERIKKSKIALINRLRNDSITKLIPWFDAICMATDSVSWGKILRTGNDGNFEISENFMKCLKFVLLDTKSSDTNKNWINGSLFDDSVELLENSLGYFYPDGYKGPNCTSNGSKDKFSLVNPWDYILAIEGTLFFAGNVSRRSISTKAVFPFTVKSSLVGYGSASEENSDGEIWIPLWDNPATYPEIKYLFNEGRAQIGNKYVNTGAEFARSLASLGTERGISKFQRFGMLTRKGDAHLASSLGKIKSGKNIQVNLLVEIDEWLKEIDKWLKKIKKNKKLPNPTKSLLRNMDDAIIKFCTLHKQQQLQEIMIILGNMEQMISNSSSIKKDVKPFKKLSFDWINACYDGSPEFRLAVSLASISDQNQSYPIRYNFESVKKSPSVEWDNSNALSVWKKSNLVKNMIAVLERRCIDAQIHKTTIASYLEAKIPAPVKDVLSFLENKLDHKKINNLLLPLSMINYDDHPTYENDRDVWEIPEFVPELFISLKSNFPPVSSENCCIPKFEPTIMGLLKSNKINSAYKIAQRRLHVTGINPRTYNTSMYITSSIQEIPKGSAEKLTAAILFPLDLADMKKLLDGITEIKLGKILI